MITFVVILVFSVQVGSTRVGMNVCNNNSGCSDGFYCDGNICKKCLTCLLLFRKGKSCVHDLNECGECLEGYEEILITESSTAIKPCKPIKIMEKSKECVEYDDYGDTANDDGGGGCPPNSYCYKSFCVKCFNCSLFNRQPPASKCAKDLNGCGACVNGFSEVAVTTTMHLKPCELKTTTLPQVPTNNLPLPVSGIFSAFFLFSVICLTVLVLIRKHKSKSGLFDKIIPRRAALRPSAPPLYIVDPPQMITTAAEEEEYLNPSYIREERQEAKVFQQPHAPYYYADDETEGENEEASDATEGTQPSSQSPHLSIPPEGEDPVCHPVHLYEEGRLDDNLLSPDLYTVQLGEVNLGILASGSMNEAIADALDGIPISNETETAFPETDNSSQEENIVNNDQ